MRNKFSTGFDKGDQTKQTCKQNSLGMDFGKNFADRDEMVGRNCWPHYNCVFRFAILHPRDIAQVQFGRMNPKMSYLIFTVCPDNDLKCP